MRDPWTVIKTAWAWLASHARAGHRHRYLPIACWTTQAGIAAGLVGGITAGSLTTVVLVCPCRRTGQYTYQVLPGRFTLDDLTGPACPRAVSWTALAAAEQETAAAEVEVAG